MLYTYMYSEMCLAFLLDIKNLILRPILSFSMLHTEIGKLGMAWGRDYIEATYMYMYVHIFPRSIYWILAAVSGSPGPWSASVATA